MHLRSEKGTANTGLFVLLSTLALLFIYCANASAQPSYFNGAGGCSSVGCHPSPTPTTCNGCHHHGKVGQSATTDKLTYSPGETVTVTFDGGSQSGWIRAYLYDNTGTLVDTSTGPSGVGGGAGFPVTLTGPAPATPGTYTFTAAWFGNLYDTGNTTNANHGQESIATNSFDVVGGATAPTVLSTVPAGGATNVAANILVTATFSEPVDPATVDNASFFLSDGIDNVAGTLAVVDNTITFTPTAALSDNTTYTATVTTAVTDLTGNALASDQVWTFTTAAASAPPPPSQNNDSNGIFGCAVAPSGGGTSGILGTYGFLILIALGAAFRKRVKRDRG